MIGPKYDKQVPRVQSTAVPVSTAGMFELFVLFHGHMCWGKSLSLFT